MLESKASSLDGKRVQCAQRETAVARGCPVRKERAFASLASWINIKPHPVPTFTAFQPHEPCFCLKPELALMVVWAAYLTWITFIAGAFIWLHLVNKNVPDPYMVRCSRSSSPHLLTRENRTSSFMSSKLSSIFKIVGMHGIPK